MIEPHSAPASPLPSYWDYETTRPSSAVQKPGAAASDPKQSARWWGPGGFILEFYETDLLNGAASRVFLRSPGGEGRWVEGVHLDIVESERVVFTGSLGLDAERPEVAGTVTFRRV
jgi:uncharacterized protein YndB with AHSA1/START domain